MIKLDMSLVRNPHTASTEQVGTVVRAEADRTGAVVVAEGIEAEDDLITARTLGARWGQVWLFGRPAPLDSLTHTYDSSGVGGLRQPRPGFHPPEQTPFDIVAGHG